MQNKEKKNLIKFYYDDTTIIIDLNDNITLKNAHKFPLNFEFIDIKAVQKVIINFKDIINYDSYLVVFINEIKKFCYQNNIYYEQANLTDEINSFVNVFKLEAHTNTENKEKESIIKEHLIQIGEKVNAFFNELYLLIEFFGALLIKLLQSTRKPSSINWKDFPALFTSAGVNALPISALIVFLVGLVTGYQGASQLKQFGADIFIADLIGISLTRTLVPMLVAILVAGRSGSSFAAEIGTMKVSDEVDALTTMGFDIYNYLVIPRIIAVMIAMPLLVIICDLIGIAGGLIAALAGLDITISSFVNRLSIALSLGDIFSGVFKSIVFAFLISSIGCFKGLQANGGASAVGKFTTSSVVAGVFLIILTDAIFTFLFQAIGI